MRKQNQARGARATVENVAGGLFLRSTIRWLFGGKDWFRSITAWGLVLWLGAGAAVSSICEQQLVAYELCSTLQNGLETAGKILTALGIRRAHVT